MPQPGHAAPTPFPVRLFNGELGLAVTYWVFGMLGAGAWKLIFWLVRPERALTWVLLALMLAYLGFIYVSIWRAATKYNGRKEWALLAKAAVIAGAVVTFVPLALGLLR
jgi:hypothetical protein